jgi:phosphohistidine phosphatase
MKTLTLIRHAKSSWDDSAADDFDRPLNPRGLRDAPEMGRRLAERDVGIQQIVASPAQRALTTAREIAAALSLEEESLRFDREIYLAGVEELMGVIHGLPAGIDRVALIGHNPGFTDLANTLTGEEIANVPTCGIVHVHLTVDTWTEVDAHTGSMVFFDYPKKK